MSFLKLFISTSISSSPAICICLQVLHKGEKGKQDLRCIMPWSTILPAVYIHWKHNPIAWNNSNAALVGSANLQLFSHLSFLLNYSLIGKPGTNNMRDSEHFCEQAWVNIITCIGHVPSWYFRCSL